VGPNDGLNRCLGIVSSLLVAIRCCFRSAHVVYFNTFSKVKKEGKKTYDSRVETHLCLESNGGGCGSIVGQCVSTR
jgi:hypothetical protein